MAMPSCLVQSSGIHGSVVDAIQVLFRLILPAGMKIF
jgi:hypothetical protein